MRDCSDAEAYASLMRRIEAAMQRSATPIYQVDAFTPKAFGGNPAAVCLVHQFPAASFMQSLAAELNLSETAFIEPVHKDLNSQSPFQQGSVFNLRWFTLETEVPLCGHATLASAAVLFQDKGNKQAAVHFETLSGRLTVQQQPGLDGQPQLQMSLPLCEPSEAPDWLKDASSQMQAALGSPGVQEVLFDATLKYVLVVLTPGTSEAQLTAIQPNYTQLKGAWPSNLASGLIMTCAGDGKQHHFFSRFFAPWVGINEDPVTGSAHSVSGPYWAKHLDQQPTDMRARQSSPRGGELLVKVDWNNKRVVLGGQATIISKGELLLPQSLLDRGT